jgi:hypothetical protein
MKFIVSYIDCSALPDFVTISLRSATGIVRISLPNTAPILKDLKVGDECHIDLPGDLVPIPLH